MARTARNSKVDTRSARLKLPVRREPYWTPVSGGCHLGYRRTDAAGSWIARFRDKATGKRHFERIGSADDYRDADGVSVFSYSEAQTKARAYFERKAREVAGLEDIANDKLTVNDALDAYLADYKRRGGKAHKTTEGVMRVHIRPKLGGIQLSKLSRGRLAEWHAEIADTPPRVRPKKNSDKVSYREFSATPEQSRRRKSTANRILTVLKAALNFARKEGLVQCRPVWELVKPFRAVDAARLRYLSDEESRRLVNASASDFRNLVTAALVTGCRYGELKALKREDYNPDSGSVLIRESKTGKPRHIFLAPEGQEFFARLILKTKPGDLLLKRSSGRPWRNSDQQRPLAAACKTASIAPLSFHELRHTYASRLIMRGVPLAVVAAQLGHADTRMVEKHYGHMAKSYVADTVRAALPNLGILLPDNIHEFRAA